LPYFRPFFVLFGVFLLLRLVVACFCLVFVLFIVFFGVVFGFSCCFLFWFFRLVSVGFGWFFGGFQPCPNLLNADDERGSGVFPVNISS